MEFAFAIEANFTNDKQLADYSHQNRIAINDCILTPTKKVLNLNYGMMSYLDSYWSSVFHASFKPTELYLSHNQLEYIDDEAFLVLDQLRVLDLSFNLLRHVNGNMFAGLFSLKRLNLESNQISSIDNKAFTYSINLQELNLKSNCLTSVDTMYLNNLSSLRVLDLSRNRLANFKNQSLFQRLTQLKSLFLNDNRLSNIDSNLWTNLNSLELLNLSHNQLSYIGGCSFSSLVSLKFLFLNDNRIRYVDPEAFLNLNQLVMLCLNSNWLSYIDQRTFKNMLDHRSKESSLRALTLHNNLFCADFDVIKLVNNLKFKNMKFFMHKYDRELIGNICKSRHFNTLKTLIRDELYSYH